MKIGMKRQVAAWVLVGAIILVCGCSGCKRNEMQEMRTGYEMATVYEVYEGQIAKIIDSIEVFE